MSILSVGSVEGRSYSAANSYRSDSTSPLSAVEVASGAGKEESVITIGCHKVGKVFESAMKKALMRHETLLPCRLDYEWFLSEDQLFWSRDNRVCLHDGSYLLPGYFELTPENEFLLAALAAPFGPQFVHESVAGKGYKFAHVLKAAIHGAKESIPMKSAKSCIEGGNCFLFYGKKGEKKAIVGMNSIALTFAVLEKRGFSDLIKDEIEHFIEEEKGQRVSIEAIWQAKNLAIYKRILTTGGSFEDAVSEYLKLKQQPTKEEESAYYEEALKTELMWDCAKAAIADDLNVPIEDIGFIYQETFHIDMRLFVIAPSTVYVQDEKEALKAITIAKKTADSPKVKAALSAYAEYAKSREALVTSINRLNLPIFKRLGLRLRPVAGCFQAHAPSPDLPTYNFMNNLILGTSHPKTRVIATGGCKAIPFLIEHFTAVVQKDISAEFAVRMLLLEEIDEEGIKGKKGCKDLLSLYLTKYSGGLRCLTNMKPVF